ncbi:ABC transporter ATP-binding protein [Thermoanaerobacterium thermosaccharolyticum]|uniref:ABC transporter ATP-binding protein n=1 Tax=Thermoanaerobacterium thermosaccharolyticum TaxID=1517 RepID=UPI00123BEFE2|nr:ABC transporter ATP-binding protein [Thermoanaerobacterium thermosaccharolyticum]KAA5808135.1 ABC transporter ATP-binding protein [Thermoanaerobacterium thermosaccharolyticum]
MSLLSIKDVSIDFGGIKALIDVNIELEKGSLTGLIGPNGAGKSTVFNIITGIYKPTSGKVIFDGKSISQKPYNNTKLGIARTFQNIRLFKNLTVLDNVKIAQHIHVQYGLFSSFLQYKKYLDGEKSQNIEAMNLLKIFNLDKHALNLAKNLPYGEQRRLEIARALGTKPKLLLLDEPAAGMNPQETKELTDTIRFIRDKFDITILLIEHDMSLVMDLCEDIYVMNYGKIIAHGAPDEIKRNPEVIAAYLGEESPDENEILSIEGGA